MSEKCTREFLEQKAAKGERLFRLLCEACAFDGMRLRDAKFLEAIFRSVTITHSDFGSAYLPQALFEGCHLTGVRFTESYLRGTEFRNCRFRSCDFHGANLTETKFVNCDILQNDFSMAEFSEAIFVSTKIKDSKFILADFSNVSGEVIAALQNEIKGAILPIGIAHAQPA